jgi:preprotein translocase subunit SecG
MGIVVLIIEILLCLMSVFIVAVVLLQSGKSAGLSGDIAGGAESFLGKSKAKSYEGKLKKLTKIAAVGIMVLAVGLVLLQIYGPGGSGAGAATSATPTPTATVSQTPPPLYETSPTPSATVVPTSTATPAPSAS